jgi:hypothetical protein
MNPVAESAGGGYARRAMGSEEPEKPDEPDEGFGTSTSIESDDKPPAEGFLTSVELHDLGSAPVAETVEDPPPKPDDDPDKGFETEVEPAEARPPDEGFETGHDVRAPKKQAAAQPAEAFQIERQS